VKVEARAVGAGIKKRIYANSFFIENHFFFQLFYKEGCEYMESFIEYCNEMMIATENSSVYYRVTYNNEGIYNALKRNVSMNTWKELLNSNAMKWLPKPPSYQNNNRSFFTKEGFKIFEKETLPIMRRYLNSKGIKIEKVIISNNDILYRDKYQVVTK